MSSDENPLRNSLLSASRARLSPMRPARSRGRNLDRGAAVVLVESKIVKDWRGEVNWRGLRDVLLDAGDF